MDDAQARRFAETALALYGHEGTFEIAVADGKERAAVVEAFERLGCAVEVEPLALALKVTGPAVRAPM